MMRQGAQRAAEQGNAFAQGRLGVMYLRGQGVQPNYVQAHKWFSLAASRLQASEKEARDLVVKSRDLAASKMSATQIAEAQMLSIRKKGPSLPKHCACSLATK